MTVVEPGAHRADDSRWRGRGLGLSTRVQVSGHNFFARRAVLAMTRRRVRMEAEPGRRQSMALLAGVTITAVLCLGALFWSLIRPAGSAGQARIVADQDSGALYVRVGDKLYPALNLSSARLIAGEAAAPVRVRRSEIEAHPRGPLVGIAGAPQDMAVTSPGRSSWLVCDEVTKAFGAAAPEPVTVTVIDGQPDLGPRRRVLGPDDALVRRYEDGVWLIRDGRRSLINQGARAVLLALGLGEDAVSGSRPMSRALFDAIPVGPELSVPMIPNAGLPARFVGAPGPVGTVVSTPQVGGQTAYSVVLTDGMQPVSPVVAQVLQNAGPPGSAMPVVAGPVLAKLPVVQTLDLSAFPPAPPHVVDSQLNASACWHWEKVSGESMATTSVIVGPSIPVAESQADKVVDLVKDPGAQMQADRVYLGPEYANYVVCTGNSPSSNTVESLWWISESGVRFGVQREEDTMNALGLKKHSPNPAPWLALRLLAAGPALSRADALTRHNTLPVDTNPAEVPKS
ncbi:type VII secretion protein EccB [Mycobacterium avium subsp. hominissuis]|uniref:type VII secretion protein EccB n=1 Tax=Mycobacterium avium TaxID=1764 RepID=UPI001CC56BAB|nr:type VII secretion protein EccB [Mycobacterium avium]MBZ4557888.1 type VII secretion protein EccB [Mycobacterium avium subsp. hominissuis]MBZ4567666.1 type VII secretion protein EccB [Mycobacterium avium subsp. hominissuis]MBZ4587000.1 type VII secretion protein EccB [Mycobacterium avium subsp. hominissuis]MBZ4623637.1 type VII secretion protein EccB [Mycobacterium avium subsp. hominissuis]